MRDDPVRSPRRSRTLAVLAVLAACAGLALPGVSAAAAKPAAKPTQVQPPPMPEMVVEGRAMELLRAMSERLAAAKSMSFTALVGYEFPSRLGPPLVTTMRYEVAMQRPDGLRVLMPGDGPASEFYFDGKTMTAFAPAPNLAAVADAPPTLDAMLAAAYDKAAIYFPFTDLLAADPLKALAGNVKLAFVVGQSELVGGVRTDMLAWADDEVFLQIWIGADDKLPRRLRAIYKRDAWRLRHEMEIRDWQIDPTLPADTFTSAKAQAAPRMAFANPTKLPPDVKPLAGSAARPASRSKASKP